jgi:hypothetical protein
MHDVVGAQKHVAFAVFVGAGQGARVSFFAASPLFVSPCSGQSMHVASATWRGRPWPGRLLLPRG